MPFTTKLNRTLNGEKSRDPELPLLSELIEPNWGNPHWTIDDLAQWLRQTMNPYFDAEQRGCEELEGLVRRCTEKIPTALRSQIEAGDDAALVFAMRSAQETGVGPGWLRDAACAAVAAQPAMSARRGRTSSLQARMESIAATNRTACVYYVSKIANEDYGGRWPAIEITAKAENLSIDAVKKRLQAARRYGVQTALKEITG